MCEKEYSDIGRRKPCFGSLCRQERPLPPPSQKYRRAFVLFFDTSLSRKRNKLVAIYRRHGNSNSIARWTHKKAAKAKLHKSSDTRYAKPLAPLLFNCNYFAAKVTFIVVPTPTCDFSSMSAPYSDAMCLTMASPSPVPPVSRLREALTL